MMRRISMTISPMVSSATLRVLENGALKTGMPSAAAASRSTWSVPMQKQPTAISGPALRSTRLGELGAAADADDVGAAHGLDQRVALERLLVQRDARVARPVEQRDGGGADALEQDDLGVGAGEGGGSEAGGRWSSRRMFLNERPA